MLTFLKKKLDKFSKEDKIYIFFTRRGVYFLGLLFVFFLISFTYGHSLAYSSCFLLFAILMVSANYTNYNLCGLKLIRVSNQQGHIHNQNPQLHFILKNYSEKFRFDVDISLQGLEAKMGRSFRPKEALEILLSLGPMDMGWYHLKRLRLNTLFPFGLMYSWKFLYLNKDIFIFPNPKNLKGNFIPWAQEIEGVGGEKQESKWGEDFYAHRRYVEGESTKYIDWKAYAREKGLLSKTFEDQELGPISIYQEHLKDLPEDGKLPQVMYWVQLALDLKVPFKINLWGVQSHWVEGVDECDEILSTLGRSIFSRKSIG